MAPLLPLKKRIAELEAQEDVRLPLIIHWNRAAKSATVEIAGQSISLVPDKIGRWIDLEFRVNFLIRVQGMAQMLLMNADHELQLYVSPVNWKPDAPPVPMSYPEGFAGELFDRLGYYRTLGWAEATWPLNEDRMNEDQFMEDLYRAFDDRAQVILDPNMKKWSGDHGGYDFTNTAGVLITSKPISTTTPSIIDVAPTVLTFFGLPVPGEIDGKPLW